MLLRCPLLLFVICQARILPSNNLQTLVSGFGTPADIRKSKAVDKNWRTDVENVYTRIAPETSLFEHKETGKIFFGTSSAFELARDLGKQHYRESAVRKANTFQSLIEERKWSEIMHRLVCCWDGNRKQTNLDFLDTLARIADLDGCDDQNGETLMETALCKSASYGKVNHIEILLRHGASVDLSGTDAFSRAPLIYAAEYGHDRAVKVLLSHQANPNVVDRNGKSAFHHAASKGYVNILEMLWNHGAQIDTRSNDLKTPLHFALLNNCLSTSQGRCNCVEFLVKKGANPHLEDSIGQTAIEVAINSHEDCEECLSLVQNADAVARRHKTASQESVTLRLENECRKNAELERKNIELERMILQLKKNRKRKRQIEFIEETKSHAERKNRKIIED